MDARETPPTAPTMDAFFAAHYLPLQRFAYRRIGDHHLAEEVAVDCLVLAWQRGGPETVTRAWLFRTARNRLGDLIRRRDRDRRLLTELQHTGEPNLSPTAQMSLIADALELLPRRDREILELLHWDELSVAEIAELTGSSASAVWKRSSRAHHRLRKIMEAATEPIATELGVRYALDR